MEQVQRRLGLLGGMAWPSTMAAYRQLNQRINTALGGVHSADVVLRSFDFAQVEALQEVGDWAAAGHLLGTAAGDLRAAGAQAILLCTNTMHQVADAIEMIGGLPLLHIVDPTAAAARAQDLRRVGLLGTAYTMEGSFYRGRLERHGLAVVVPDDSDRELVHDIIYDELVNGVVTEDSRARLLGVIERLAARGAAGVIGGCTELELLVDPADLPLPWLASTALHVDAAADWMLGAAYPTSPSARRSRGIGSSP